MANTITAVLPSLYAGLRQVSRELVGFIPNVQRNVSLERAAVGQTVSVPVVPAATGGNITPGSVPPDDGDQTMTNIPIMIDKSKYSPVRWNGEEQLALGPDGVMYNMLLAMQFAESMRWLVNQIEVDLAVRGATSASRAYGTAGTTPFGTAGDLTDLAGPNRILDQNGASQIGRTMIVNSDSRFNLEGKQSVLFKANEAGTDGLLRRREMLDLQGFGMGFSAGLKTVVKGTGSGYLVNNAAGYPIGATTIAVDTGTGTVLAGDIVTFAGDVNKYVVKTALAGNQIVLQGPGLLQAVADNVAITVGNNYAPNIAFSPDGLVLAARAPALPDQGDSAEDRTTVTDTVSGLNFEVSLYKEYRRIRYEVAMAWGTGAPNPEHIALLLG
jgi:hypothetical protein